MKPEVINRYFKTKQMLENEIKELDAIPNKTNKQMYFIKKRERLLEIIEDKLFDEMDQRYNGKLNL